MPTAPFQLISIDDQQVIREALAQTGLWEEGKKVDRRLVRGFAAVEVIRRLIEVAQLPLHASLEQRAEMARVAQSLYNLPNHRRSSTRFPPGWNRVMA